MLSRPGRLIVKRVLTPLVLMLIVAPVFAQQKETPRESFQSFIDAVLIEEANAEERTAAFDRYFDFETWLANKQKTDGKTYTETETAEFKQGWYDLFRSAEFRKRYAGSDVVVEGSSIEGDKAELKVSLGEQQFRVLMNKSADGLYWRWYDIPLVEKSKDPATQLKELEKALQDLRLERARLNEIEEALLDEIAKLRADLAEEGAGDSPYATPRSVVATAWKSIEGNKANALLDCHTSARIKEADAGEVKKNIQATSERLMSWEILDSTIDARDPGLALVRVRIKLQRTGEPDDRTINVRVVRVGENWKIDEEP